MLASLRLVVLAALTVATPASLLSACGGSATSAPDAPSGASLVASSDDCDDNWGNDGGVRVCETRTVALDGGTLMLNAEPNGSIDVSTWDRDGIEIQAHVKAWAMTEAEAQRLVESVEVEQRGTRIRTRLPERTRQNDGRRQAWASVSYEVLVPRDAELDLRTVNGGIDVDGVAGSLQLSSVNGGLELIRVGGRVDGQTVNGPVRVELIDAPTDGLSLRTTNGPVTLDIPDDLSAEVDARTSIGPVSIQGLPLTDDACEDKETSYAPCLNGRVVGTLGRGGPALRLRTTNGPIALRGR
ncbi:MAG: hypothetical protein AAGI52_14810 [Bacteroidota bacterium]